MFVEKFKFSQPKTCALWEGKGKFSAQYTQFHPHYTKEIFLLLFLIFFCFFKSVENTARKEGKLIRIRNGNNFFCVCFFCLKKQENSCCFMKFIGFWSLVKVFLLYIFLTFSFLLCSFYYPSIRDVKSASSGN